LAEKFFFVKALSKALLGERGSVVQWILIIVVCALLTAVFFSAVKPGASDFSSGLGELFNRIVK